MRIAAIAGIERGTIRFEHSEDLIVTISAVPFDTERELGVRVRDVRSCRHIDRGLVLIRKGSVGEICAIARPVYAGRNTSRPSNSDFLVRCRRHGYRARGRVGSKANDREQNSYGKQAERAQNARNKNS